MPEGMIFESNELAALGPEWVDSPAKLGVSAPTKAELQALLDERDITYDKRWGTKRLNQVLEQYMENEA
jgi:hypothetical protein